MDDPTQRDALLLESIMSTFSRRPHSGTDPSRSASALTPRRPRLRWVNLTMCPHCVANGRPCMLERRSEWGPMISRSDGLNFHLVLCERPIEYPSEPTTGKSEMMMSAGFWYVHEGNDGSTETVVVLLRRPPRGVAWLRHLETVADKLYEKLCKLGRLPSLYEFDGRHLRQISH